MSELKPGDRALVINVVPMWAHLLGRVVSVTSFPFEAEWWHHGVRFVTTAVMTDDPEPTNGDGLRGAYRTTSLLRLPPEDEAKRLFRETEKPREVSNA